MRNPRAPGGVSGTMPPFMRARSLAARFPRSGAPTAAPTTAPMTKLLAIVAMGVAGLVPGCADPDPSPGPIDALASFGEVGRSPGQLVFPRAMALHEDQLIVVDKSARVQRLDAATGRFIDGFRMPELELGKPTGLSVGAHPADPSRAALYVADTHYHRVLIYDLTPGWGDDPGKPRAPDYAFGAYGTQPGRFVYPTDVAVLHDERGRATRLFVSEYGGNDRVTLFDVTLDASGEPSFTPVSTFGAIGVAGEENAPDEILFSRPQSLAIDLPRGELLVCDACNHRIGRFTLDGELIAWTGSPQRVSSAPGDMSFPYHLALLDDGAALVAEFGNSRVQWLDPRTGESLGVFGEPGRGPGQLATPWAVVVSARTAFVLDSGNDRVLAFRSPRPGAEGAR